VNFLLDTQIILWVLENNAKLSPSARAVLTNSTNRFHVSSISVWELVIKNSIGKLPLPVPLNRLLTKIDESGFARLEFKHEHALHVATLPSIHGDPFDRALVAQAFLEPMHLLTADVPLGAYGGTVTVV
jgi:PIN domain nuclease of toxin-antitoxin system